MNNSLATHLHFTEKRFTIWFIVIVNATDKHPAQVGIKESRVPRAVKTTTTLSGRISTLEKSHLLARCDALVNALKKARQTANDVEHSNTNISESFVNYLFGKWLVDQLGKQ